MYFIFYCRIKWGDGKGERENARKTELFEFRDNFNQTSNTIIQINRVFSIH
jgi:hypothetical protein